MPLVMSNGDVPDIVIFNGQEVTQVVSSTGESLWEKNTSPERWEFNSNLTDTIGDAFTEEGLSFTSDSVAFTSIKVIVEDSGNKKLMFDEICAYKTVDNTWSSADYRTVSFTSAPLGKLRTWLQQNATLL